MIGTAFEAQSARHVCPARNEIAELNIWEGLLDALFALLALERGQLVRRICSRKAHLWQVFERNALGNASRERQALPCSESKKTHPDSGA